MATSVNDNEVIQQYLRYLPQLLQSLEGQIPGAAQQNLQAAQDTSGGYNALNLQQLLQYGLPLTQAGTDIQRAQALGGAQTNLAQIQGAGGQAATAAQSLENQLNPALAAANSKSTDLLNSISLNGLSPGEYNSTERALNTANLGSGNLGLNNNTNAISNAMNFGGAFNNKLGILSNAIGTATGAGSAMNQAINPTSVALGQPGVQNGGMNTFGAASPSSTSGSAGNVFGFGQNALGNMFGAATTNAQTGTQTSIASGMPAYISAMGSAV